MLDTQRNAVVDARDLLTQRPLNATVGNYPLKGELVLVTHAGQSHERWQHELSGGARIWFYADEHTAYLLDVHTRHPNQTK